MSNYNQPRVPKGVPEGGEWTVAERAAAIGVSLVNRDGVIPEGEAGRYIGDAERHSMLIDRGYVPATWMSSLDDPRHTARRADWWAQHFVAAEYGTGGKEYPKMPDDYTPGMRGGHALSGHRRTHRMRYEDGGVTVRIPSMAAIRRYSKEVSSTFDVPFSAINDKGEAFSAWVRVTELGGGGWNAEPVGFDGPAGDAVSEIVMARLERRGTRSKDIAGLLERHRERFADTASHKQVKSSWIESVGYDKASGVLFTRTSTGASYGHHVTPEVWEAISKSRAPGRTFNQMVRGLPRAEVTTCQRCSFVMLSTKVDQHRCPVGTHRTYEGGTLDSNVRQRAFATKIASLFRRR